MFRIQDASTAVERIDELCRFIEFWVGPRRAEYGEPPPELAKRSLPEPLRRFYAFAGRWPRREPVASEYDFLNGLFTYQDRLVPLRNLETAEDGKRIFLYENQGVWDCRTLPTGDDPPVWNHGDICDEDGNWLTGERQVCDSLSKFLVTFVLQELTFGSERCLPDEHLESLFVARVRDATPLWIDGPYVEGRASSFYLFDHLLAMKTMDSYCFATNSEEGFAFIEKNQARIIHVCLDVGFRWSLTISEDGSALLRFSDEQVLLARCPPQSFDFDAVRDGLLARVADEGAYARNPTVSFPRAGQKPDRSHNVHDWDLVQTLFRRASRAVTEWEGDLEERTESEWCSGALDRSKVFKRPGWMRRSVLRSFGMNDDACSQ